jgi:hypothetical protein
MLSTSDGIACRSSSWTNASCTRGNSPYLGTYEEIGTAYPSANLKREQLTGWETEHIIYDAVNRI